jgi:hypothetical protein
VAIELLGPSVPVRDLAVAEGADENRVERQVEKLGEVTRLGVVDLRALQT